jgi:hypothetical protein
MCKPVGAPGTMATASLQADDSSPPLIGPPFGPVNRTASGTGAT